ncbi:MAG: hypothetical protein A2X74_03565 [Polynucleobacter sp. GWA2_45_21]|nr:MAG: hypothetical protein A2X74_03565 [Polynucleobacter sp. GWA2_45_21]HBK44501.1 hypothetical protein [Polynucleobacter sp.]
MSQYSNVRWLEINFLNKPIILGRRTRSICYINEKTIKTVVNQIGKNKGAEIRPFIKLPKLGN